ncbi:hypothetical protein [Rhodococcus koreensis]|jgi:hypothetical protein|uniref:Anti-sigma-M factor RsmA n=1 Tax=Rhodococcus koreensis TaxID=99653 RepID=A0A1H4VJA6_9NOCA|nr:hypothetical protein [Rhodococcus koreensis]QSE81212.1 hypothetical protein JWS14_19720 [Rhodococcus koreensis]SEC80668.1 hypothetical protein SAMN04490239_5535 [Rhodococcus koreensis]
MADRESEPSDAALPEPPYSEDLLADLHAGVLPESVGDRLWPLVRSDPQAMAVIDALDRVTDQLGALGRDHSVSTPIPADIADRINRALAAERDTPAEATVVPIARRRKWAAAAAGTFAAAAAVVVAVAVVVPDGRESEPPPVALPSSETSQAPEVLDLGSDLDSGRLLTVIGSRQLGPLEDPDQLAECLRANGIDPARALLGSGEVRLDGVPGVLLLVAAPRPPQITALVVGRECGAGDPATIAVTDIG